MRTGAITGADRDHDLLYAANRRPSSQPKTLRHRDQRNKGTWCLRDSVANKSDR